MNRNNKCKFFVVFLVVTLKAQSPRDQVLLLGDFNAELSQSNTWRAEGECKGEWVHDGGNDKGERLLEMTLMNGSSIMNTFFCTQQTLGLLGGT